MNVLVLALDTTQPGRLKQSCEQAKELSEVAQAVRLRTDGDEGGTRCKVRLALQVETSVRKANGLEEQVVLRTRRVLRKICREILFRIVDELALV